MLLLFLEMFEEHFRFSVQYFWYIDDNIKKYKWNIFDDKAEWQNDIFSP